MKAFTKVLFGVLIGVFVASYAFSGIIRGTVLDEETLAPIANARIDVYALDSTTGYWGWIESSQTDQEGKFYINDLGGGIYIIRASKRWCDNYDNPPKVYFSEWYDDVTGSWTNRDKATKLYLGPGDIKQIQILLTPSPVTVCLKTDTYNIPEGGGNIEYWVKVKNWTTNYLNLIGIIRLGGEDVYGSYVEYPLLGPIGFWMEPGQVLEAKMYFNIPSRWLDYISSYIWLYTQVYPADTAPWPVYGEASVFFSK